MRSAASSIEPDFINVSVGLTWASQRPGSWLGGVEIRGESSQCYINLSDYSSVESAPVIKKTEDI